MTTLSYLIRFSDSLEIVSVDRYSFKYFNVSYRYWKFDILYLGLTEILLVKHCFVVLQIKGRFLYLYKVINSTILFFSG